MIYLLVVIFTNLFLGIGLAVLLQSRLIAEQPLRLNRLPQRVAEEPKQEGVSESHSIVLCTKQIPELAATATDPRLSQQRIPSAWLDLLDVDSFSEELEPAWCMLRSMSRRLKDRLLTNGIRLSQGLATPDGAQISGIHQQLSEVVRILNQRNEELQTFLEEYRVNHQFSDSFAQWLLKASVRLDQVVSVSNDALVQLQPTAGNRGHVLDAMQQIQAELDSLNYYLRDQSQMVLSEMAITMDENQAEDANQDTRQTDDPESAWDFCRAYTRWFGEVNSKDRSLCMGLIDVNGVGNLNRKHTNRFVDRLLAGIGQQLTVSVRKSESGARCFRVSGQTFALLLRDVDGQAAIVMMDRFRQAITDSTFLLDGQKVKTKVNTATLEIDPDESVLDALQRVEMTMTHAKEVGPDQNAIMMNGMVTVVEAQRENPTENLVQL